MNAVKILVMIPLLANTLSVYAWKCEGCGEEIDDSFKFCDRLMCGKARPVSKPKPDYTHNPIHRPSTSRSYPRTTSRRPWTPFKFTMAGDVGIPNGKSLPVYGWELGLLWNDSGTVYGLLTGGVFNKADRVAGLQTGAINNAREGQCLQVGAVNVGTGSMIGGQIGVINTTERDFCGIQIGAGFNAVNGNAYGLQIAGIENCMDHGSFYGVQIGVGNLVDGEVQGLQIVCVNGARTLKGVQIGLFNIVKQGGVPFSPVINMCF